MKGPQPRPAPAGVYSTAREAIDELERKHGKRSGHWTYYDAQGQPVGIAVRWDGPSGKDFRPVSRNGQGWVIEAMPDPRPLYALPDVLAADAAQRIYVFEGEKCVDAARALGLMATTSVGGAMAATKTDWSVLAGREVVILPDHDDAGQRYADDVAGLLAALKRRPTVRMVCLPDLPAGGDIVDFIAARRQAGKDDAAIRAEVEALVSATPPVDLAQYAPTTPRPFEPFPLASLPVRLRTFVAETAQALGCDPTFVALPALSVVASAIGTTRNIELKASWCEPAIVWAGAVARSGSLKSPAFEAVLAPLVRAQAEALRQYKVEMEAYEQKLQEYERELAMWKKGKSQAEPPQKPEKPVAKRYVVSDSTVESLGPLLEDNPRGLLLARDELSGWVRGFNQYKGGRGGDTAAWLELHRAGTLVIDRKTGDRRTIFVPRAAVSVCGTIQPGILASTFTSDHVDSGLAARLLLARPPQRTKRWSDRIPSRSTLDGYESLIRELLSLQHDQGNHGPDPRRLNFTAEARQEWITWYDVHAARIAQAASDREAAALAKIEGYAARFALIFSLAENPQAQTISKEALRSGIALANWFTNEAERVYELFDESDDDRDRRELVELIQRKGGSVTARDLMRSCRIFQTSADGQAALNALVAAGLGAWELAPVGPKGGQPTKRFRLLDTGDVDSTPPKDPGGVDSTPPGASPAGGSVNVNGVSGPDDEWGEL